MRDDYRIPDIPVSDVMRVPGRQEAVPASPSVLVATAFDQPSAVALRRAQTLARVLEAHVVLLHVVPPHSWINALFPHKNAPDAVATQALLATAMETATSWYDEVLGPDAEAPTIILKRGHVAPAIVETAERVHASLVVLGDSPGSSAGLFGGGSIASSVIHQARRPVLVARPERPGNAIIAATNFADAKYPALLQAARLGARLDAHVTFVHNVEASDYVAAASLLGLPLATTVLPREPDLERRQHELEDLAHFMGSGIEAVVVAKGRSSDAILDVARARDADLVVVGARSRGKVAGLASRGTTTTVAREAKRSVLTVPLLDRQPAGWAA